MSAFMIKNVGKQGDLTLGTCQTLPTCRLCPIVATPVVKKGEGEMMNGKN